MNRKIWKALGIAVCMLALAAPRAMAETHVHTVTVDTNFAEVVKSINASKDEGEHVIELHDDITLKDNYTLTNGKTTTIKSKDENRTISIKDKNAGITVTGEGTVLNLVAEGYDKKLTIDGDTKDGSESENTRVAFITVSGGATANMYEHVTLQNWKSAGNACVVIMGSDLVTGPNSAFNMKGGVIEGCSRAVMADSGATFNMSGGEIRNCKDGSGNGGGVRVYEATFVMSDGTISGCSASNGGGLCAEKSSTVTITGGTISGCTASKGGGLYADNSTIEISGGVISGCKEIGAGGGLYADHSTVTIKGGTISECEAAIKNGGGLYATNSSKITISGGTISGCEGKLGGGLYATNSSEITISGGTISGCDGRWGGGLYANNSTVTISGGAISGCEAGAGGGLYVVGLTLNIKGGTISECMVSDTGKGGGLFADQSTLTISGGTIKGNKAAYGGGVALRDSRVKEEPITSWTVVDNEAYKTDSGTGYIGGGIYLENGSMDVSDGSNRIYNNTADGHGADICLEGDASSIKLPNAANMGVNYHDSGINIDGWYNDNPRYTPSENGVAVNVDGEEPLKGALSLVASYKAIPVRIEIDANGGEGGSGSQTVHKGTNITLEAPTKEGHLFKGWKDGEKVYREGETLTVTGDMTLTAEWKKLPSAENLPKTGDESPVLLWGAALAVSAAACFMLRRRK